MDTDSIQAEVLSRIIKSLLPVLNKNTLVLFTGGSANADALLDTVDSLLITEAKIAVSPAFQRMVPEQFIERIKGRLLSDEGTLRKFIASAHLIAVPVLTRNTLVKAALGIEDTIVTNAVAAGLMRGLPLIGVKENYHPGSIHAREKGYNANSAYNELLLDYEQKLRRLGATLVDADEFADTMKRALYPGVFATNTPTGHLPPAAKKFGGNAVITCAELIDLPEGGIIEVAGNSLITPLAREHMERRKLTLVRIPETK